MGTVLESGAWASGCAVRPDASMTSESSPSRARTRGSPPYVTPPMACGVRCRKSAARVAQGSRNPDIPPRGPPFTGWSRPRTTQTLAVGPLWYVTRQGARARIARRAPLSCPGQATAMSTSSSDASRSRSARSSAVSEPAGTRTTTCASKSSPPAIGASRVPVVIVSIESSWPLSTDDTSRTIPGRSLPSRSTVSRCACASSATPPSSAPGCVVTSSRPSSSRRAPVSSSTRSVGTPTTTIPANLPASSASWLSSQLPSCAVTTSARALTRPARSSPMTVSTSLGTARSLLRRRHPYSTRRHTREDSYAAEAVALSAGVTGSAARRRGPEAGERVEVAHQGVATTDAGLVGLGAGRVRRQPQEPRQDRLVLRVVVAVGALRAVGVRALPVGVGALREADRDDRVTGLEDAGAAVLRRGGRDPRVHRVVDERVVRPLGDLVADRVDVLQRPVGPAVRAGVEAGTHVGRPREGLHRRVALRLAVAEAVTGRLGAVVADDAAVVRVVAAVQEDVVRQVERQVRRVRARLEVGDLRRPPADVHVAAEHAPP